MSAAHEIVARLRAQGASEFTSEVNDASTAVEDFGDQTEESTERAEGAFGRLGDSIGMIAGMTAAAGAGLEAMNRSQQDSRVQAGRVDRALGLQEGSIHRLAAANHDATRDMGEMVSMMETAAQRGVEGEQAVLEYAEFWDKVGDATGEAAGALSDGALGLQALGVEAGNESEALAALGFIAQETGSSVGEFLEFASRNAEELQGFEGGVDGAAAALGLLEDELNLTGRQARTRFREALSETDGSIEELSANLGIGAEKFEEYTGRVADSSDVIDDNAAAFADSRTTLQNLSASLEGTMAKYSGLTAAGEALSPVMMGGAAAMMGANQASQFMRSSSLAAAAATKVKTAAGAVWTTTANIASIATRGLGAAFRFMLGPIGLAITAIGAAVAAGIWLYRNWDEVKEKVGAAVDWIGDKVSGVFGGIVGTIRDTTNGVIGAVNGMIDGFNRVEIRLPVIPEWVPFVGGKGGQTISLPNVPRIPTLGGGSSGVQSIGSIPAFNTGGLIPGRGPNVDSVLAALTPGEWVLNRDASDALGPDLLAVLNRLDGRDDPLAAGIRRMVTGPAETHEIGGAGGGGRGPQTWRQLSSMMGGSGVPHRVTSTVRNWGGASYHETGHAIDLAGPTPSSSPTPAMGRIFDFWAQHAGNLAELIYAGRSRNVKNGRWVSPYAVAQHRDHVHVAATAGGLEGAVYSDGGDGSGIPRWARPLLTAILSGFRRAFGLGDDVDHEWAGGAVIDRPWTGRVKMGEHEREFVTPESQLAAVIDERLDAGGARGDTFNVTLQMLGDVLDPEDYFRRNRHAITEQIARELAARVARR